MPDLEGVPPASPRRCINLRPQPGQQQVGNRALIQQKTLGMDFFSCSPFLILQLRVLEKAGGISKDGNRQDGETAPNAWALLSSWRTEYKPCCCQAQCPHASPELTQPQLPEASLCCIERGSLSRIGGALQ